MSSILGKFLCRQLLQILFSLQVREKLGCLGLDMLRETECASLLRNTHRSRSARPIEYILEQMMMDRAEVRKVQVAVGKRFAGSRIGNLGFEIVEFALVAQIKLVNEDRRIFVGVRIVGRVVHATATQALR